MNEKRHLETREKPLAFSTRSGELPPRLPTMVTSGGWEQKCWGKTQRVFQSEDASLHKLILDVPYSFCSIHYHLVRDNRFTVVSGALWVVVRVDGQDEKYFIEEGNTLLVPAGLLHQFQVSSIRAVIWECYTAGDGLSPVDDNDIVRQHEGGVNGQPLSPGSLFLVKK